MDGLGQVYFRSRSGSEQRLTCLNASGELLWHFGPGVDELDFDDLIGMPDGGVAFIDSLRRAMRVDAAGAEAWRFEPAGELLQLRRIEAGPDGMLLAHYQNSAQGATVVALDAAGQQSWRRDQSTRIETLIVTGAGTLVISERTPEFVYSLFALDSSGTELWRQANVAVRDPVTTDVAGNIYYGVGDLLVSRDANGEERFSLPFDGSSQVRPLADVRAGVLPVAAYRSSDTLNMVSADGAVVWNSDHQVSEDEEAALRSDGGLTVIDQPSWISFGSDGTELAEGHSVGNNAREFALDPQNTPILLTTYLIIPLGADTSSGIGTPGILGLFSLAIGTNGNYYCGALGELQCLDPNGTTVWSLPTSNEVIHQPLVLADGTAFVPDDKDVFAASSSGSQLWKFTAPDVMTAELSAHHDGFILAASRDEQLYAIDEAGALLWQHPLGDSASGAALVDSEGGILVATDDGVLHALDHDGNARWTVETGLGFECGPMLTAGGLIVVAPSADEDNNAIPLPGTGGTGTGGTGGTGTGGTAGPAPLPGYTSSALLDVVPGLLALSPDGTQQWNVYSDHDIEHEPISEAAGRIYVASGDNIAAVSSTGAQLWSLELAEQINASPQLDEDGRLFVLASKWMYIIDD